ncbi:hypothetical protein LTS18_009514 [Coniosporium uncinatum]|uniref:Uncharacterized protein n=1 Tax=Coniosporium uncinatum TaxID=93489 RepID=A0ACC3DM43_9PEZI|nr:hypothetical protein LTS18_009514 [Coniosporium uncinatum]
MRSVLAVALLLASTASAIVPARQPQHPTGNGTKLLTWNATQSGQYSPRSTSYNWVDTGIDGQYIYETNGSLILDSVNGTQQVFVPASQIPDDYYDFWIKPDLSKVLFATNYTKQYRHSYFADYQILDRESGQVALLNEGQLGDVQYATWSPTEDMIAFVRENDLYIWDGSTTTRVTNDGGPDLFNGVPDWVYEEEVSCKNSLSYTDSG